jgi:hypothetical protein
MHEQQTFICVYISGGGNQVLTAARRGRPVNRAKTGASKMATGFDRFCFFLLVAHPWDASVLEHYVRANTGFRASVSCIPEILTRIIACNTLGAYPLTAIALTTAPTLYNVLFLTCACKTMAAAELVAMAAEPLSMIVTARVTHTEVAIVTHARFLSIRLVATCTESRVDNGLQRDLNCLVVLRCHCVVVPELGGISKEAHPRRCNLCRRVHCVIWQRALEVPNC